MTAKILGANVERGIDILEIFAEAASIAEPEDLRKYGIYLRQEHRQAAVINAKADWLNKPQPIAKGIVCELCGQSFVTAESIRGHRYMKHGVKRKP